MSAFSHTVRLSASALSWLTAKLSKWPTVKIGSTQVEDEDGTILFDTCVSLNAPVIPGHTLLARIEHLDEGNVIYRCAGEEKASYRTCKPWCDHCKTARRRNDTFVLLEESTNREKQVGRNCLAEYVRDEGAAAYLLNWADCVDRIIRCSAEAEEHCPSGRVPDAFSLPFVIGMSLAYGGKWVSASQARETGEQSSASYLLGMVGNARFHKPGDAWWDTNEGKATRATLDRAHELANDETSDAHKTIAWIKSLAGTTDYENNLSVIGRIGFATTKQWGFVCSAFRAWLRAEHVARGEKEQAARAAQPVTGAFVGTIGKRTNLNDCACTLVKSLGMVEAYGGYGAAVERFLVKFVTPAGETLTWFTSDIGDQWETGKSYNIAFTPKKHEEYNKVLQTTVNRVAIHVPKVKKSKKAS